MNLETNKKEKWRKKSKWKWMGKERSNELTDKKEGERNKEK